MPKPMRRAVDRAVDGPSGMSEIALKSLKARQKASVDAACFGSRGRRRGFGGLFGAASLPIELPVTTILILRAIADIARHHGEDLSTIEGRLACVEVFAMVRAGRRGFITPRGRRLLRSRHAGQAANEAVAAAGARRDNLAARRWRR